MNKSDNRRIPVPEVSTSPSLYQEVKKLSLENNQRSDGRAISESRSIYLKTDIVTEAKGSAYIEVGNTKVICAVYGPHEFDRRNDFQMHGLLKCQLKFAPFSCPKRRSHIPDSKEAEMSQILTQALLPAVQVRTFPKSQVDVFVTVLENDGGCMAAAVLASAAALTDAAIEMFDLVTASSVRIADESIIVDPSLTEEYRVEDSDESSNMNHGNVMVALLPMLNQVSAVTSDGALSTNTLLNAVQSATESAQKVYPLLQKAALNSIK